MRRSRLFVTLIGAILLIALVSGTTIQSSAGRESREGNRILSSLIPAGIDSSVGVSWIAPPPQTSSRFLHYSIEFSQPVRGITGSDFESDGAVCTFTVPIPSAEYSITYSVLMTCPAGTYTTVNPRLVRENVSTETLDATAVVGELVGGSVEIIPGTVLTVNTTGSGTGSVTSNLSGINCGLMCTGAFPPGTRLILTAQADPGSIFVGWSGPCSGTSTCTVTLSQSLTVNAQFVQAGTIVVTKLGLGGGTVAARSTSLNCGATCRTSHRIGQTVTVTAAPTRTSRFVGWLGACSGTAACVLTISTAEDYFLYAIFEPR